MPADPPVPTAPPLPSYALGRIFRLRDDICREVARPFFDDVVEGQILHALAEDLAKFLKARDVPFEAVFETVRANLLGKPLSRGNLYEFAWRLAGNLHRLKAGGPAPPWTAQHEPEWLPMQVMTAFWTVDRFRRLGCEFQLRVLAGSYCPGMVRKSWRREVYTFLAVDQFGFTKPWGRLPFRHPFQLVGLRFYGLAEPSRSLAGRPGFHVVSVPGSMAEHNRSILGRRYRIDPCPEGFRHDCHRCSVGYDRCKGATHPVQYESGPCPRCAAPDAVFDTTLDRGLCLQCLAKKRTTPPE